VSLSTHVGGTIDGYRAQVRGFGITPGADLDRRTGLVSANIDVPFFKSGTPGIGRLSVNGNIEKRELSDFGSLTNWGGGMNWTPISAVTINANYSAEETAPSMAQLGGPQIITPLVPIFDFTQGQSVLVTRTSGGNPALRKLQSDNWRLGLTVKPFTTQDLTLQVSFARTDARNGIGSILGLTAETQAAFPDRFLRDADGTLIAVNATPINIASQRSSELRWGFNFSKRLSLPQGEIDAMRAMFETMRAEREARRAAGQEGPRGPFGDGPPPGERRSGGSGLPGGGSGAPGGRMTAAVFHTIKLEDKVELHSNLPIIDLLDGGSLGGGTGTPRHQVELQLGASRSGIGLRFTGKWQSATRVVDTGTTGSSDLRFGDLATFSLRAFVNPSQLPDQMGKNSWLRSARISLSVDNILNTRRLCGTKLVQRHSPICLPFVTR
jgi:iron complex outermembrane recepter protein